MVPRNPRKRKLRSDPAYVDMFGHVVRQLNGNSTIGVNSCNGARTRNGRLEFVRETKVFLLPDWGPGDGGEVIMVFLIPGPPLMTHT